MAKFRLYMVDNGRQAKYITSSNRFFIKKSLRKRCAKLLKQPFKNRRNADIFVAVDYDPAGAQSIFSSNVQFRKI